MRSPAGWRAWFYGGENEAAFRGRAAKGGGVKAAGKVNTMLPTEEVGIGYVLVCGPFLAHAALAIWTFFAALKYVMLLAFARLLSFVRSAMPAPAAFPPRSLSRQ